MSYCIAWKKDHRVFLVSESAISSLENDVQANLSTFGEVQGLYGKYYVQEGLLKLFQLNSEIALAFSGNISIAAELLKQLYSLSEMLTIEMLQNILINNYQGLEIRIILVRSGTSPEIFLFDGTKFDRKDRCEIGSGRTNSTFSKNINKIIDQFQTTSDEHDYLAKIIANIQCYSLRNHCIQEGYGGTFYGIVVGNKIDWFRDIGYYIYENDIHDGNFISVINRRNSVFSSSNCTDHITLILNSYLDIEIYKNPYLTRAVKKSLDTKNSFYFVVYSKVYNRIIFLKTNHESQNFLIKKWIKRDIDKTHYAFAFSPILVEFCEMHTENRNNMVPAFVELPSIVTNYMPHEAVSNVCDIPQRHLESANLQMDFDFTVYKFPIFDTGLIIPIKRIISNYHNIVVVDYHFMSDVCKEVFNRYSCLKDLDIQLFDISTLVSQFLRQVAESDFNKYLFIFVKDIQRTELLNGVDFSSILAKYDNVQFIEVQNFENDLCGAVFQLIKNYYINDRFFHLDKFILVADNRLMNALLCEIIPEFNFCNRNPDFILVRNINHDTQMDGRFLYIVIDYWLITAFGINMDELGELDFLLEQLDEINQNMDLQQSDEQLETNL